MFSNFLVVRGSLAVSKLVQRGVVFMIAILAPIAVLPLFWGTKTGIITVFQGN